MADNMNQENAPKIYIMGRDNYDLIGTGEAPPSAPLEYGDNIFFVRENSSATSDCLSLYVGQAKQCDVWDITDDPEVQYDPVTDEVDIPDKYQIRGKIYIYENEISPTEKFIRLFIWDGVSYVSVGGSGGGTSVQVDHITINDDEHILTGAAADITGKVYSIGGTEYTAGSGAIVLNNYPLEDGSNQNANYSIGDNSVSYGSSNKVFGARSLVGGIGNSLSSNASESVAIGSENIVSQNTSYALGASNNISAAGCMTVGTSNTLSQNNDFAFGTSNTLSQPYNFAFGQSNTISTSSISYSATYSLAVGSGNNISQQYCFLFGAGNTTSSTGGAHRFIFGSSNSSVASYSTTLGTGNSITSPGNYYFVSGHGNNVKPAKTAQGTPQEATRPGNDITVIGSVNSVAGQSINVIGKENTIQDTVTSIAGASIQINNISIIGSNNRFVGRPYAGTSQSSDMNNLENVYVIGHNNKIISSQSHKEIYSIGYNNGYDSSDEHSSDYAFGDIFAFGYNLDYRNVNKASWEQHSPACILLGSYNEDVSNLFSGDGLVSLCVGCGDGMDINPRNSLVLTRYSELYLPGTYGDRYVGRSDTASNVISGDAVLLETKEKTASGTWIDGEDNHIGEDITLYLLPYNSCITRLGNFATQYYPGKLTFSAYNDALWYPGKSRYRVNRNIGSSSSFDSTKDIPLSGTETSSQYPVDYSSVITFRKNPSITNPVDLVDNFSTQTTNPRIYLLNPDIDISTFTYISIMLFFDGRNVCAIVYGYEE